MIKWEKIRTFLTKYCMIKQFNKNPKYDGYQRGLTSMVFHFLIKKTSGGAIKNENMSNK